MRSVVGILFVILGAILGLYIGGWVMFINPILACATAFDAGLLTGAMIASTVLKCVFASFVGGIIFWIGGVIGITIMK